jgi:hypothetical protein
VTLIGAITAAIVSIVTAFAQFRTGNKVEAVHHLVNGQSIRMEQLARATGVAEGRAEEPIPLAEHLRLEPPPGA